MLLASKMNPRISLLSLHKRGHRVASRRYPLYEFENEKKAYE
jgi:hypothetical protein